MKLKIYKKPQVIKNTMLFVFLALVMLFINNSIQKGVSFFNQEHLIVFLQSHKLTVGLAVVLLYLVSTASRWALWAMPIYLIFIVFKSLSLFMIDYNKILLITSFILAVCSFYFFIIYKIELQDVIYKPGFLHNQIYSIGIQELKVKAEFNDKRMFQGFLTNISPGSCFIYLPDCFEGAKGRVKLNFEIGSHQFMAIGEVFSRYDKGLGVKIMNSRENSGHFDWKSYVKIILDRGYQCLT